MGAAISAASGRTASGRRHDDADRAQRRDRTRRPTCGARRRRPRRTRRDCRASSMAPPTARRLRVNFSRAGRRLAQRLDRQHLRGASGRDQRREDGHQRCRRASETTTVRGSSCNEVLGRLKPAASIRTLSPLATPRPSPTPSAEAAAPSDDGLQRATSHDLAPGGADGPHQRDLSGALGDDHRKGVPDDEATDEQRDAGEDHEQDPHDLQFLLDGVGVLLGHRGAGDGLGALRHDRGEAVGELGLAETPSSAAHADRVEVRRPARGPRCAVAASKYADVLPPRFFSSPKPTVPTTVNSAGRALEEDLDGRAELDVVLLGAGGVDGDLVRRRAGACPRGA